MGAENPSASGEGQADPSRGAYPPLYSQPPPAGAPPPYPPAAPTPGVPPSSDQYGVPPPGYGYPPPPPGAPPAAGYPSDPISPGIMLTAAPIPGMPLRGPRAPPQPGQVLLGYETCRPHAGLFRCEGLSSAGLLWVIILLLIFWPVAWIPCVMPECFSDFQRPVYGWPGAPPPAPPPPAAAAPDSGYTSTYYPMGTPFPGEENAWPGTHGVGVGGSDGGRDSPARDDRSEGGRSK